MVINKRNTCETCINMKIAYVIEKLSGIGGMERILTDKMNYLAEHTSHEVVLLLLWKDEKPMAYGLNEKVKVIRLDVQFNSKLKALLTFRKVIREIKPDITIYTWVMGALLSAFSRWKGKSIYEAHRARPTMRHQWIMSRMEKKVDAVVALTEQDSKDYPSAHKVVVIPNFTSISVEKPSDCTSKRCLAVGRLIDVKNFSRLLDIWQKVSGRNPDWHLDIVGEGPEREILQQKIERLGLGESVSLHKATHDVASYYTGSSLYLMTSRFEGLPMVLLEAQSCGLPIITLDCDYGPRHIVDDGVNGCLIPYDDDDAMVSIISQLMQDKEQRQRMGAMALQASRNYQPQAIMKRWLALFEEI